MLANNLPKCEALVDVELIKLSAVKAPLSLSHQMVKNFERAPFARFVLSLRSLASLAHSTRSLHSLTTLAQNSSPSDALIEYQTMIFILYYQFGF